MELWLYCVGLYAWQCLVWLPPGGIALVTIPGGVQLARGPGRSLLWPWPGSGGFVLGGWPFEICGPAGAAGDRGQEPASREALVHSDTPHPWDGSSRRAERWRPLEASAWSARGCAVLYRGAAFTHLPSPAEARSVARFLNRCGAAANDSAALKELIAKTLTRGLDRSALADGYARARNRTRALRWLANGYFLVLFLLIPILLWVWQGEAAWWRVLPWLLLLHLATVGALTTTCLRWRPVLEDRWEKIVVGALYPPALLRAPFELVQEQLVGYQPIAAAAAFLKGSPRLPELIRAARADLQYPSWSRQDPKVVSREPNGRSLRRAFLEIQGEQLDLLARDLGIDGPEVAEDPTGITYCALCSGAFRAGVALCNDCGIPTEPFRQSG